MNNYGLPLLFRTGTPSNYTIWLVRNNPFCSICNQSIREVNAALIVDWNKEGVENFLMHIACVTKWVKHPLNLAQYRLSIIISDVMPSKGIPVIIGAPGLSPRKGDVSVYDIGKIDSDKTTDNTRYVPLLDGDAPVFIGAPDEERLKELDRGVLDVDGFLEDLKISGQKAITENNKGLLE